MSAFIADTVEATYFITARHLWLRVKVTHIVKRRLTTGILSEQCAVKRFRCCANVIDCTYTNLDGVAYYTPRLYGIAYCS